MGEGLQSILSTWLEKDAMTRPLGSRTAGVPEAGRLGVDSRHFPVLPSSLGLFPTLYRKRLSTSLQCQDVLRDNPNGGGRAVNLTSHYSSEPVSMA